MPFPDEKLRGVRPSDACLKAQLESWVNGSTACKGNHWLLTEAANSLTLAATSCACSQTLEILDGFMLNKVQLPHPMVQAMGFIV